MGAILRIAWDRFSTVGKVNGDYIARFLTTVFYFTIFVPFALIASLLVDPLEMRKLARPHWRVRKPVSARLEDARSQY